MRKASGVAPRPGPVTPAYLERAALHYLERYASTAGNLRRVLARKARRRLRERGETAEGLDAAIGEVVDRIVRSGLVDDASFARMKVGALMRRGTSSRAIRTGLTSKGVTDVDAEAALAEHAPDDLLLARRHAARKRLGPYRVRPDPDPDRRKRDLAALCRAGFAYRIAVQVIDGGTEADEAS